jgi:hypothetical protein
MIVFGRCTNSCVLAVRSRFIRGFNLFLICLIGIVQSAKSSTNPFLELSSLGMGNGETIKEKEETSLLLQKSKGQFSGCNISLSIVWVNNGNCQTNGGSAMLLASGGVSPYVYTIINANTGQIFSNSSGLFTNLPDGSYQAYSYDSNQCQQKCDQYQFVIQSFTARLDHTVAITYSCSNQTGHNLALSAIDGIPPFLYSVGGVFSTNTVFSNLSPGTYMTTVMDAAGCSSTVPVTINAVTPILVQVSQITHEFCTSSNGLISLQANGGTAPYTYTLYNASQNIVASNSTGQFTNLSAGSYSFSVTDANGCLSKMNFKKPIKLLRKCPPCGPNANTGNSSGGNKSLLISLYPNPAENRVNVAYKIPETSKIRVVLMDFSGRLMEEHGELPPSGELTLELGNYESGTYFVGIVNEGGELIESERLIILK